MDAAARAGGFALSATWLALALMAAPRLPIGLVTRSSPAAQKKEHLHPAAEISERRSATPYGLAHGEHGGLDGSSAR
jgi:hypothetical protein